LEDGRAALRGHRHRSDHPGPLSDDDDEGRARPAFILGLALRGGRHAEGGFRTESPGSRRRDDPRRRPKLRLRLVARARAVGARRLRLSRGRQQRVRGHLPQQRAEERFAACHRRRRDARVAAWQSRSRGHRRPRVDDADAAGRPRRRVSDRRVLALLPDERAGPARLPARAAGRDHRVRAEGGPLSARVVVLPGDGVGPEVTAAATDVLRAASSKAGLEIDVREALIGGAAFDATGSPLPDETIDACRAADAVLLGAVGGPKWADVPVDRRPEAGLLGLRKTLGLFANLRPVRTLPFLADASPAKSAKPANVDIMVVRALTGGIYFGKRERTATSAFDSCEYTVDEIERVLRAAGRLAQ